MISSRRIMVSLLFIGMMMLTAGCFTAHHDGIHTTPTITSTNVPVSTPITYPKQVSPSGYWIEINPIDDKQEGEIFPVNSTTNLPDGDIIFVEICEAKCPSLQRQIGDCNPRYGNSKVFAGKDGNNTIPFIIDSSAFNLSSNQYLIVEYGSNASGYSIFNISKKKVLK